MYASIISYSFENMLGLGLFSTIHSTKFFVKSYNYLKCKDLVMSSDYQAEYFEAVNGKLIITQNVSR